MFPFGYCTNVHAAGNLAAIQTALETFALPLKKAVAAEVPLPIGLWLNESVVNELGTGNRRDHFASWLAERGLLPTTLNGFPQRDFHQPVVKHAVYQPTWADPIRLAYTCQLAEIHAGLLKDRRRGTISTLPLGWVGQPDGASFRDACRRHLLEYSRFAEELERRTGFHSRLCLEAEPGCYLGNNRELREFLLEMGTRVSNGERQRLQRYLGVCFDVCHAAVMFEDQAVEFREFQELGMVIGKVQISSALVADFRKCDSDDERQALREALRTFAEPKYLHQTMIDGSVFYEDLTQALARQSPEGEWRVHFHVPIFAETLSAGLSTTQNEIGKCMNWLADQRESVDWEIETYAWPVLPETDQVPLLEGIQAEFQWLAKQWNRGATPT